MNLCPNCKKRPKKKHFNGKWCAPCAAGFVSRPRHNLTPKQERLVRKLGGTMYYEKLAKKIGASRSSVMRFARDTGVNINALAYKPEVVRAVALYYAKHGKRATEKQFPHIKIRSIVDRYKIGKPRQVRWTDEQLVAVAKMAGLVSYKKQAKIFNRPNAKEGSIKSLFSKRMKFAPREIHGMSNWKAKHLVTDRCPRVKITNANICLWTDMKKHMRNDAPAFIKDAIQALAEFQCWLYNNKNPKKEILKIRKNGGLNET